MMKKYLGMLSMAILGGLISLGLYTSIQSHKSKITPQQRQDIPVQRTQLVANAPMMAPDFVEAANLSVHAVVHIKAEFSRKNYFYDDFFGDFFNPFRFPQQENALIGTGSGVIISPEGYIVTNNHVVQDASKLEVTLNDKRVYEAKIIGTDPSTDLALIKIEETDLPYLTYGNSDDLKVGEWVLAVGNPFNLTSTVTAGIVSAKARNINILSNREGNTIESFIQTDAAVNRGNSGGALVNTRGELVGINAAIASGNGYYTGYSFAIPVNIVRKVVKDLLQYGEVQRAYIGVQIREVDADLAKEKGLERIKGVYVAGVMENGSAEKAGIKPGDVITSVQGIEVNSNAELLEIIGQYSPGDKISVTVERKGTPLTYDLMLTNDKGTTSRVKKEEPSFLENLGASFRPASEELKRELGIQSGVEVVELKPGALSAIGIKKGFIITRIDRIRVNTAKDVADALKGKRGGVLIEGVYPNGVRAYYGLGL
ncbi:MAG: Do family serine endopeptidase [Bacteroidales bacterium]|jgi:Do/DeqQ family serine protease